jgi:hypothetical protein
LFSVSKDGFAEVRKAYVTFFETMRKIVGESQDPDTLVLFCGQMMELGNAPAPP